MNVIRRVHVQTCQSRLHCGLWMTYISSKSNFKKSFYDLVRQWLHIASDERLWRDAHLDVVRGNDGTVLPDMMLPKQSRDGHYRIALRMILDQAGARLNSILINRNISRYKAGE